MKIDPTKTVGPIEAPRPVARRGTVERSDAPATDQVALSKGAAELRKAAFAAAPELKGASAERVAQLRDAFKNGTLRADPSAIADKMLAEVDG